MVRMGILFCINAMMAMLFLSGVAVAQGASPSIVSKPTADDFLRITDDDIQIIRKDVRSHQKQIIAANMKLTDSEAEKFWPVYDQYIAELDRIDDTRYALLKQGLQSAGVLTDAEAEDMVSRWLEVDQSVAQLRTRYIPHFRKILSSKKTALFCQLDRHVQLAIDLQLASPLPLIQP
jgi:hypothetical protein